MVNIGKQARKRIILLQLIGHWLVIDIHLGNDCLVCVVTVKTSNGVYKRPIAKIVLLLLIDFFLTFKLILIVFISVNIYMIHVFTPSLIKFVKDLWSLGGGMTN